MQTNINKHQSPVNQTIGNKVYLSIKNLASNQLSQKLSNLQKGPFKVTKQVSYSYRLKLPAGLYIYNVFAPNILQKDLANLLPGQENPKPVSILINRIEEQEVQEILASKLIYSKLIYCASQVRHNPNLTKYPTANFKGAPYKLQTYYNKYLKCPGLL